MLVGAHVGDIHSLEDQLPFIQGDMAGDQIEKGGFAGPVGADDGDELPLLDCETDAVGGDEPVKGFSSDSERSSITGPPD